MVPSQEDFVTPTKARGLDGWPEHKYPRLIQYRVTLLETALALTAAGHCAGYFPKFVVERFNDQRTKKLKEISYRENQSQDVFIVKRIGDEESKGTKRIAKILRGL